VLSAECFLGIAFGARPLLVSPCPAPPVWCSAAPGTSLMSRSCAVPSCCLQNMDEEQLRRVKDEIGEIEEQAKKLPRSSAGWVALQQQLVPLRGMETMLSLQQLGTL
jgi:hypothetical protein